MSSNINGNIYTLANETFSMFVRCIWNSSHFWQCVFGCGYNERTGPMTKSLLCFQVSDAEI